jgi:hypothetical protein
MKHRHKRLRPRPGWHMPQKNSGKNNYVLQESFKATSLLCMRRLGALEQPDVEACNLHHLMCARIGNVESSGSRNRSQVI